MSSYIAVELKVIEGLAPQVARSSGADEDRVLAGLVRLWHRCWTTKSDMVTRGQLAGVMGAAGLEALAEALVDFGFLDVQPTGWRVRGAEKYLRVQEGRSKGGRAAVGNLRRGTKSSQKPAPAETDSSPASSRLTPGLFPADSRLGDRLVPGLSPNTEHRAPSTVEETTLSGRPDGAADENPPAPATPVPPEALEDKLSDSEFQVFEHWRQVMRHPKARATPERKRLIARALKIYSVAELQRAISGCRRSPHHMGQNDRHQVYDDLELILRDAKHVEQFMRLAEGVAA